MNEIEPSDPRPLLQRGCPICGGQLGMSKEIAWYGWLVALLIAIVGWVFIGWLSLLIALVVPLTFNKSTVECNQCDFKKFV